MSIVALKTCLQDYLKFDSNTERILSVILDRDSEKWFRPAKGQFSITYRKMAFMHLMNQTSLVKLLTLFSCLEPKTIN